MLRARSPAHGEPAAWEAVGPSPPRSPAGSPAQAESSHQGAIVTGTQGALCPSTLPPSSAQPPKLQEGCEAEEGAAPILERREEGLGEGGCQPPGWRGRGSAG